MREVSTAALLVVLITFPAGAQDQGADGQPQPPAPWTRERIESPPKREIKFERVAEARKERLSRPEPKLLAQRYSASLQLTMELEANRGGVPQLATFAKLPFNRWKSLFSTSRTNTEALNVEGGTVSTVGDSFEAAIAAVPADQRPEPELARYFTSDEIAFLFRPGRPYSDPNGATVSTRGGRVSAQIIVPIELLAASADQAEQVATGFLQILDWGICRQAQLEVFTLRNKAASSWEEAKQKLVQEEKGAILDVLPPGQRNHLWSGEIAKTLNAQRVQLLVDQAGIRAKVQTCERLLAREGMTPDRRNTLEDERLKAEVDLASVEARLAAISATFAVASAEVRVRSLENDVGNIERELHRFAPPALVDGAVVIRPLEWQ